MDSIKVAERTASEQVVKHYQGEREKKQKSERNKLLRKKRRGKGKSKEWE